MLDSQAATGVVTQTVFARSLGRAFKLKSRETLEDGSSKKILDMQMLDDIFSVSPKPGKVKRPTGVEERGGKKRLTDFVRMV